MRLTQLPALLGTLLLAALVTGCGVLAPGSNAGYADLDSLGFGDTNTTMNLSFGSSVLRIAAMATEDDPETNVLLENLDGVRVRKYEIVGDEMRVAERIDDMSGKLQGQGWIPVITIQEQGERVVVLMKPTETHIAGLVVISCDAQEAVVVNVMGKLQPELFSQAMADLAVDAPEVTVNAET